MERIKRVVRVLRSGVYPDSRDENRRYWLARPPSERVKAGRALRRDTYRQLHGAALPAMGRTIRPFRPEDT